MKKVFSRKTAGPCKAQPFLNVLMRFDTKRFIADYS